MITLNPRSTTTLTKMISMMVDGHVKIDNSDGSFMPVVVEEIFYTNLYKIFSVAHYFEQNGDLMADPEMCFIFNLQEKVFGTSYYKQDGYLGREQESAFLVGDEIIVNDIKLQADHTRFATIWLRNIMQQQRL